MNTLLVVLPADVADQVLAELQRDLEARGWTVELSRGDEQIVLVLSGDGDAAALAPLLAGRVDADLIEVPSRREYRRWELRRRFASGVVLGLGFAFVGLASIPVIGFLRPPHEQLVASDLVRVAAEASLPAGGEKRLSIHGQRVLVVRREDGSGFAIGGRCTHLDGCLLEWSAERQQLVCPCCGGAYDAYGNVIEGPPSIPLRTYPVERIDGVLYVRREE
jgi:cytochrome b6-f complex iron-sulfur subunit